MPLTRCADVASLVLIAQKITNSEDPMFKIAFPLWHVLLVPLITRYPNEYCPPMVAIGPKSLSLIHLLLCPAA